MDIPTDSPLYLKAFAHYLRKGTPIEISLKAMMARSETTSNHSTNLYIWGTAGDNKVRASHAANNGKIFAWDSPPSTGNPGDAINCRCWAEPYVQEFLPNDPTINDPPLQDVYPELLLIPGGPIARRVGGEIIRRIGRGSEKPPAQKPTRSIEDRPENVPKDWVKMPSRNGKGIKYVDPKNSGDDVRLQKGNPDSDYPGQRSDYVRWKKNGQWLDKNGRPSLDEEKTHIPLEEFNFDLELFK